MASGVAFCFKWPPRASSCDASFRRSPLVLRPKRDSRTGTAPRTSDGSPAAPVGRRDELRQGFVSAGKALSLRRLCWRQTVGRGLSAVRKPHTDRRAVCCSLSAAAEDCPPEEKAQEGRKWRQKWGPLVAVYLLSVPNLEGWKHFLALNLDSTECAKMAEDWPLIWASFGLELAT